MLPHLMGAIVGAQLHCTAEDKNCEGRLQSQLSDPPTREHTDGFRSFAVNIRF